MNIRPHLFALAASDVVISDELCLDLNHCCFCMHDGDQLVEGQVVATNFGVGPMVPSFTIIDSSVKNEPHCQGLCLVCS